MADGLQGTDFYGFVGRQDAETRPIKVANTRAPSISQGGMMEMVGTGCSIPAHDAGQVHVLAKGCHDRGRVVQNETDQQRAG